MMKQIFGKHLIESAESQKRGVVLGTLSPAWLKRTIEVDSDATICGIVVFKGMVV